MTIEGIATQRAHHRLGPAAPLSGQPSFISALYNSPFSTRWFVISFGVDTSLAAQALTFAPSTSTDSIAGGLASNSDAFAISA